MKILILGGGGFLGCRLAQELLTIGELRSEPINTLTLLDQYFFRGVPEDERVNAIVADFADPDSLEDALESAPDVIFHLAAIVSGEAEKNFELGMRVNLQATLELLEQIRKQGTQPVLVFTSSCAVFGGDVSKTIDDRTAPTPQSSYGSQKAVAELLINDYSRREFVDGRSLRLPTIAIRPGAPNAATSSFISSIIREPLNRQRANCPVAPETEVWVQSAYRVTANLIHAANLGSAALGENRIVTLPGLTTSVQDMVNCLRRISGQDAVDLIDWEEDEFLRSIVLTWPPHFRTPRAESLGFQRDSSIDELIQLYVDELNEERGHAAV